MKFLFSKRGQMAEENRSQINMEDVLEKKVVQIKLRTLLIVLLISVVFGGGYYVGQRNKTAEVIVAGEYGFTFALKMFPVALYAQEGNTFCKDGSNIYRTKKVNNYLFQITKDQSVPRIKKEHLPKTVPPGGIAEE